MENLIEQLKSFNTQIQAIDDFSTEKIDYDLIGIRFYRFIQNDPILKKEFDGRAKYFENLTEDKEFLEIQGNLIKTAQEFALSLRDKNKELDLIQKEYNNQKFNALKLKMGEKDDLYRFLTIPEYITHMQDEKNYYRMGERLVNTTGLERQFDVLSELMSIVYLNIENEEIKTALGLKVKEYDGLHRKLREALEIKPAEINHKPFKEVYTFALCTTPHEGLEFWYHSGRHQYHQYNHSRRFYNIKKYCGAVITDLIFCLQGLKEKQAIISENIEPVSAAYPKVIIIGEHCFLQLSKTQKLKIGKIETRKALLAKSLGENFGILKAVNTVFDEIRLPKDENNPLFENPTTAYTNKLGVIKTATKEINRTLKIGRNKKIHLKINEGHIKTLKFEWW